MWVLMRSLPGHTPTVFLWVVGIVLDIQVVDNGIN